MTSSFSSDASNTSTSTNPTALPSEEALEILLSPDGYYTYLNIPKPDPSLLTSKFASQHPSLASAPDAYDNAIDLDLVKKNYRRLSLRHHPDRKTGDPETFRILHRAKVVLSSAKLRREYDLVGLDLDDEDDLDGHHHEDGGNHSHADGDAGGGGDGGAEKHADGGGDGSDAGGKGAGGKSSTETVMGHLASTTLAAVLQMVVRTGLMGLVSVLVTRYTILTYLALGGLAFIATRIYSALKKTLVKVNITSMKDVLSPLTIALGIYCMYRGRRFVVPPTTDGVQDVGNTSGTLADESGNEQDIITYASWSWTFWLGETIVMTLFLANSFENATTALTTGFSILSLFITLWLRGKFWRYATLLGFEGIIALLVVMAFPVMEMILEEIVQDKMRKVGEKIRAHDARTKERLRKRKNANSSKS